MLIYGDNARAAPSLPMAMPAETKTEANRNGWPVPGRAVIGIGIIAVRIGVSGIGISGIGISCLRMVLLHAIALRRHALRVANVIALLQGIAGILRRARPRDGAEAEPARGADCRARGG